jgi:hypothetical protein
VAAVARKVESGQGSLGLLVNDPGLYDDARALLGKSNRNKMARDLVREALKKGEEKQDESAESAVAH